MYLLMVSPINRFTFFYLPISSLLYTLSACIPVFLLLYIYQSTRYRLILTFNLFPIYLFIPTYTCQFLSYSISYLPVYLYSC